LVIGMAAVKSFRDLNVYRLARDSAQRVFQLSQAFPAQERYSLTDQIRRSSRAIKAMVAEAWARRRYKAAFINKIDEALGESNETQSWLDDCLDCSYISAEQFRDLDGSFASIGSMLARMIDRAEDFCRYPASTDFRSVPPRVEEEPNIRGDASLGEFFCQSLITNH
jgi:four helix bundle protein